MGKSCLVAGGAGFIGSHLCQSLLKDGYKVICIDNFLTGLKENVEELMDNEQFTLINADVIKKLPEVVNEAAVDYVFHLASPASPNAQSSISYLNFPLQTMDVNSIGTRRLLKLAKTKQAKFLFASTSEIYGDPDSKHHPQKENYWGNVNSLGERACYDESKRFGETLTMVYYKRFDTDVRIVRIFNTYGPKMNLKDGRAMVNFIVQALKNEPITVYGKGSQTRSFCYADDLVAGIKKAMFSPKTKGQVFNLGNPDEQTVKTLALKIKQMTGSKSKVIYEDLPSDDPGKRKPDVSKAKKQLKWAPGVSLAKGLEKTIEDVKKRLKENE